MKKIVILIFTIALLLTVVSCKKDESKNNTNIDTDTPIVNIKSLSAKQGSINNVKSRRNLVKTEADNSSADDIKTNITQYIVMYKTETDISFTITLDNPKGESIDAVELVCDDKDAQIYISGEWEYLSDRPEGYVVNWASENAYKKTYYFKTVSRESINTLKVTDIKVNGQWQKRSLSNNELKIYKMDATDLQVSTIKNTEEMYYGRVTYSDKIRNITLKAYNDDGSEMKGFELVSDKGDGFDNIIDFKMPVNGVVKWSYTLVEDEAEITWNDEKKIELMEIIYTDQPHTEIIYGIWLLLEFVGTDVDIQSIQVYSHNLNKSTIFYKGTWGPNLVTAYGLNENTQFYSGPSDIIYVYILGIEYLIDFTQQRLILVKE